MTARGRGRIRVLPEHLANRIAAGEVIQRPESVVKELLENALDAGARRVAVLLAGGGMRSIQVADDGWGMDEEDAVACFLRHATSKVETAADLDAIRTYGFRGEALASIAAVARVSLTTRRAEEELATVVRRDGGGPPRMGKAARDPGTTVLVQDLFYNTPARRKFLKTEATEFRHAAETVQRAALARPETGFLFSSEGDTILDAPGGDAAARVACVFGEKTMGCLLPVEEAHPLGSVTGYIGRPSFVQKTRTRQYLFLNGRPILHRGISHAVYAAYEHLLVRGTHPFFLLFLTVDPARVDVNIHPSKLEAKFEDEQAVHGFIAAVVRRALGAGAPIPGVSLQEGKDGGADLRLGAGPGGGGDSFTGVRDNTPAPGGFEDGLAAAIRLLEPGKGTSESGPGGLFPAPEKHPLLWQVRRKYILLQDEQGLVVIDQHVAHERVLYEDILRRLEGGARRSQQLLFPRTLEVPPADRALLGELGEHLEQAGFGIRFFGKETAVLDSVPPELAQADHEKAILEVLGTYREFQRVGVLEERDALAKSLACRGAVKAGQELGEGEMLLLVRRLAEVSLPFVCPHGRPVLLRIPLEELDRRFGRK
ncbi:MAG: DNA mismatch repair endonuclease MutL [Bacteroidota bacterium]